MEHIMLKPIRQTKTSLFVRLSPQQELARAVLAQAVADACSLTIDERERLAAAAFLLNGAEVLWFWCAVGGLDPRVVRRYARQLFDRPRSSSCCPKQRRSNGVERRPRSWPVRRSGWVIEPVPAESLRCRLRRMAASPPTASPTSGSGSAVVVARPRARQTSGFEPAIVREGGEGGSGREVALTLSAGRGIEGVSAP